MGRNGVVFVLVIVVSSVVFGFAANAGDDRPGRPPERTNPKVALELQNEGDGARRKLDALNPGLGAQRDVEIDVDDGATSRVASAIADAGARVLGAAHGVIEATVSQSVLEQIASRPDVEYVAPLLRMRKHAVTSEGLQSTSTNVWQALGYRGRGVKIGVIDGSFARYTLRQSTGDLPQNLITVDFCGGQLLSEANDGVHGTAVAEIVYDLAPEASLYLICIGDGMAPLQAAINYAKTQGIKVVNFSAGYIGGGRGDGRGAPGSPEALVADAVASGITWVNSAGNYSFSHWSGTFAPAPGTQWQLFASGDQLQSITVPSGREMCAVLTWDEWPAASSDYDLYLYGTDVVNPLTGSARASVGTPPREALCYTNTDPANTRFGLGIYRRSGSALPRLDLTVDGPRLEYPVAAGSIAQPATVDTVIAVGAYCWQTGIVDGYSSRGPTIDGRIKPDLVGPSEVTTATFGNASACSPSFGFPGTSSAAPHVAAAAALVLQANPSFTPAQVQAYLKTQAKDGGTPGPDNDYGAGLLQLATSPAGQPGAAAAGSCAQPRTDAPTLVEYLPNVTKTLGGPNGFTTPFIIQNSGTLPTDLDVEFKRFSDGVCVARTAVRALAPGASFAATLIDDASLPPNSQFSVVVKSFGATIVAVVNEHQGSGARAEAMSYVGFSGGATTVWLPNIVRRFYGFHTPFIMQNIGTAPTAVTARFLPFDGGPAVTAFRNIQPGQSQFIEPNVEAGLVDGRQYAVTLTSAQPLAVVVNTHNDDAAVVNPYAYSTDGISQGAFAVYGAYSPNNAVNGSRPNTTSTIVVQNVGTAAVTPALTFTPQGGGALRRFMRTAPLAPGAAWSFDPRYANGDTSQPLCGRTTAGCLPLGDYSFVANASGPVAAVVNVFSQASAMGYTAGTQPSTRYSLPNVTRTLGGASGWTTPILLQSVDATNATLQWRSFRTGTTTTQTVALVAGAALRIDPRFVLGLTDDTQFAVTITGTRGADPGLINAIVMELADGADNAMIYEGFADAMPPAPRVALTQLFANGKVPTTEADEFVEFQNQGTLPQELSGWRIASFRGAQSYTFGPLTMQPGQICRLYTNEVHPEWCGLSWNRPSAQWNNTGDSAALVDTAGRTVSQINSAP